MNFGDRVNRFRCLHARVPGARRRALTADRPARAAWAALRLLTEVADF